MTGHSFSAKNRDGEQGARRMTAGYPLNLNQIMLAEVARGFGALHHTAKTSPAKDVPADHSPGTTTAMRTNPPLVQYLACRDEHRRQCDAGRRRFSAMVHAEGEAGNSLA